MSGTLYGNAGISREDADLFERFFLHQMTLQDIADELGTTELDIGQKLHQAMNRLLRESEQTATE